MIISMSNVNNIQWYPGHMAKAKREIKEILRFVDIAVIIGDARLPYSSFNPEINEVIGNKPFVYALNKTDLVDRDGLGKSLKFYASKGITALSICSINGEGFGELKQAINNKAKKKKSLEQRAVRVLVAGCPNTGKSAFINKFAGNAGMEVRDKAGVTKRQQWIKVRENGQNYDLLDTPGILPPKFETREQGEKLAWICAIKDDILEKVDIAVSLCGFIYNVEDIAERYEKFLAIGKEKGCILRGGEVDEERAAKAILSDFRSGKLGKFILE